MAQVTPEDIKGVHQRKNTRLDTLLLTLRLSKVLGVAPVEFQSGRPECMFVVSRSATTYSYLLIIILHTGMLTGLAMDLQQEERHALRVRTASARFAFIAEIVLTIAVTTVGCLYAPARMADVARVLKTISEINSKKEGNIRDRSWNVGYYGTMVFILCDICLCGHDVYSFWLDALDIQCDLQVLWLYMCFYVELFIMVLLKLQFMWLALVVTDCLKSVNVGLEQLVQLMDWQKEAVTRYVPEEITVPVRKINTLIDRLPVLNVKGTAWEIPVNNVENLHTPNVKQLQSSKISKDIPQSIRRLMLSYGSICDVIAEINDCFGFLLLLFIVSFVLHFVVTPFYFLGYLSRKNKRVLNLVHQILFIIFHFLYMLIIVEPGHRTEVQVERTDALVKQLMLQVLTPDDPITVELNIFLKQIHLSHPTYRPLRMCTISRPLMTIILGGATTYLVIILQFRQLDSTNW